MKKLKRAFGPRGLQFLLLCAAVVSGVVLASYELVLCRPVTQRLAVLHGELVQRERALALSAHLIGAHPRVLERVRSNDARNFAKLGIVNPAVEVVARIAREQGLALDFIEPGPLEVVGVQRRLPLTVHVRGGFDQFLHWIHAVEAAPVLATVEQIALEGDASAEHSYKVVLLTYLFAPGA
jgi:hypothetical protein